jgi:hypothetical protein
MATRKRIGGSFAPPLDAAGLARYRELAEAASGQVKDYMIELCDMLALFWQTGESRNGGTPHPSGRGTIIPLEDDEIKRIWDAVPWPNECDLIGQVFDGIPADTQADLRNAAFHLLWYARELAADREPITNDKL